MKIKAFKVEEWMNAYEVEAKYNIAETCVDSVSVDELFEPERPRCSIMILISIPIPSASGCMTKPGHLSHRANVLKSRIACASVMPVTSRS